MSNLEVFFQQLINGLSNGMIIALIAIGYTIVYGIVELINFAHGDLVMLGCFLALTILGVIAPEPSALSGVALCFTLLALASGVGAFCGVLNLLVDRLAYKPLRNAPRLTQLVTAIGVSFVFMNIGLFWGGLPLAVFDFGKSAAAPHDFPDLIGNSNLLGMSNVQFGPKDLCVVLITLPLMAALTYFVKYTRWGTAMRAVAQNPTAARLMGINVDQIIGATFVVGGVLGGIGGLIYALYNNTIYFQMGYRIGMDGFTAAVLGGIGNLPGAVLGGILIGILRAMSDGYLATRWTSVIVFGVLILVLIFRPAGLLGAKVREKV